MKEETNCIVELVKKPFRAAKKLVDYRTSKEVDVEKPCRELDYCPYGPLVEEFPLEGGKYRCDVFGHDCPVFHVSEGFVDESEEEQESDEWIMFDIETGEFSTATKKELFGEEVNNVLSKHASTNNRGAAEEELRDVVHDFKDFIDFKELFKDMEWLNGVIGFSDEQRLLHEAMYYGLNEMPSPQKMAKEVTNFKYEIDGATSMEEEIELWENHWNAETLEDTLEIINKMDEMKLVSTKQDVTRDVIELALNRMNEVWFYKEKEGHYFQDEYVPSLGETLSYYKNHEDERLWEHLMNSLQKQGLSGIETKDEAFVMYGTQSDLEIKEIVEDGIDSTVHAEGHGRHIADALRETIEHDKVQEDEYTLNEKFLDEREKQKKEVEKHFTKHHEAADWIGEQDFMCGYCEEVMEKVNDGKHHAWTCPECGWQVELLLPIKGVE